MLLLLSRVICTRSACMNCLTWILINEPLPFHYLSFLRCEIKSNLPAGKTESFLRLFQHRSSLNDLQSLYIQTHHRTRSRGTQVSIRQPEQNCSQISAAAFNSLQVWLRAVRRTHSLCIILTHSVISDNQSFLQAESHQQSIGWTVAFTDRISWSSQADHTNPATPEEGKHCMIKGHCIYCAELGYILRKRTSPEASFIAESSLSVDRLNSTIVHSGQSDILFSLI